MKYMLLCYDDEGAWEKAGAAAKEAAMREAVGLTHELHAKGQYLEAAPLHPADLGARVRVRDGKPQVTDGPFAETRELIAGFSIWQVRDMDEALEWAKRCPDPAGGPSAIELWPFLEAEDLGELVTDEERATGREGERGRLGVA